MISTTEYEEELERLRLVLGRRQSMINRMRAILGIEPDRPLIDGVREVMNEVKRLREENAQLKNGQAQR